MAVNEAANLQRSKCLRAVNYSFVHFTLGNYFAIVHFSELEEEKKPFLENQLTEVSPQPQNQLDSENSKNKI